MANARIAVPSPWGGISRQAPTSRHANQVEDATNTLFSVVDGFGKRPGTAFLGAISDLAADANLRLHVINRDDDEKYLVLYGKGVLRVFNLEGEEQTVFIGDDAQDYLDQDGTINVAGAEADDLILTTVADFTMIGNRKVALKTKVSENFVTTATHNDFEAMIATTPTANTFHRTKASTGGRPAGYYKYLGTGTAGTFAKFFGRRITNLGRTGPEYMQAGRNPWAFRIGFRDHKGDTVTFNVTADWTSESFVNMDDVAQAYETAINANLTVAMGGTSAKAQVAYEVLGAGNTGRFVITSPFDGEGSAIIGPSRSTNGAHASFYKPADFNILRPGGDAINQGGTGDAAWELNGSNEIADTGSGGLSLLDRWERVAAPGQEGAVLDATTMPIALKRTIRPQLGEDGLTQVPAEFVAELNTWELRLTGDNDNNPPPSIFQRKTDDPAKFLADISFLRNRLVLAAGESVVLSSAGNFFNFYIEDASNLVDSDPIDVALSTDRITLIDHIVAFQKTLVLFTKAGAQFEFNAPEALTPSTVAVTKTTEFGSINGVRPASMRNQIYFAGSTEQDGVLREYFFLEEQGANTAADVTAHTPGFLPRNIQTVTASPNNNTVLVLPKDGNSLYVYRAFWRGEQKVQSAWSRYVFGDDDRIVDVAVVDNSAYLLVELETGEYVLDRLSMSPETPVTGMPSTVHLDRHSFITGSYNAGTNETTFDWGHDDDTINRVVLGPAFSEPGSVLTLTPVTNSTAKVSGDYSTGPSFVGRLFTQSVTLSRPYVRDGEGNAVVDGRLQLRKLITNHSNTVYYRIEVEQPSRPLRRKDLVNYQVNVSFVNQFPLDPGGELAMLVQGNADNTTVRVVNDSPFPATITGMEWLAELTRRSA